MEAIDGIDAIEAIEAIEAIDAIDAFVNSAIDLVDLSKTFDAINVVHDRCNEGGRCGRYDRCD